MIYTLTVECIDGIYYEGVECVLVIEINEQSTLKDLYLTIQEAVGFVNNHQYKFYGGSYPGDKRLRFGNHKDGFFINLSKIKLNKIFPLPPKFMLYCLVDFEDRWLFQITMCRQLKEIIMEISYPRVIKRIGANSPAEYHIKEGYSDE